MANVAVGMASLTIRHGVASLATIVAACVIWTVTYVALLLWAMVSDGGLGGPLAYPAGLVFVALAASVACLLLFFPATASAEWICQSRRLPVLAQIPVSVAVLAALCLAVGILAGTSTAAVPFGKSAGGFSGWLFALSLLPVGFYWWVAQAAPLLRSAVSHLRASRRGQAESQGSVDPASR